MHEYSVIQALVDSVEAHTAGHDGAVKLLRVSIGELAGVDATLLASAYDVFRAGTICENALLEIVPVPARWSCSICGLEIPRGQALRCVSCGGEAKLSRGDEILLDQIELEVQ
jgi:hydrogenase nickel incorporation protein HypA/HybF